jgi:putrescine transport system ATP-binding protein
VPAAPWRDPAARPLLRFDHVSRRFGGFAAVDDLSLDIFEGEFFALLGPSGCGKTTLLRMLAGFETPDAGRIVLDGADIAAVPPYRRPVNMMFQSYALFPHLSVAGNIAFGLKREGSPGPEIAARVAEMVRLARLEGMEHRKPDQLSGGQRQRVALARALARRPRVLLLDEPLAALDKKLREETQFELMAIRERLNMTFIIVTHDQDEAMTLATRIGVMSRGRLVQVAEPRILYEEPATRYVAEFVGDINLFDGVADAAGHFRSAETDTVFRIVGAQGGRRTLAVRPEKMAIAPAGEGIGVNRLTGTIADIGYLGDITLYRVALEGGPMLRITRPNVRHSSAAPFARGDRVDVTFAADAGSLLEA